MNVEEILMADFRYVPQLPFVSIVNRNNTAIAQSINNTTETTVIFTQEAVKPFLMWDGSTKIIIPHDGIYEATLNIGIEDAAASFDVYALIRLNGTTTIVQQSFRTHPTAGESDFTFGSTIKRFSRNDFLELRIWQNSGGAANIGRTGGGSVIPSVMSVMERVL